MNKAELERLKEEDKLAVIVIDLARRHGPGTPGKEFDFARFAFVESEITGVDVFEVDHSHWSKRQLTAFVESVGMAGLRFYFTEDDEDELIYVVDGYGLGLNPQLKERVYGKL